MFADCGANGIDFEAAEEKKTDPNYK